MRLNLESIDKISLSLIWQAHSSANDVFLSAAASQLAVKSHADPNRNALFTAGLEPSTVAGEKMHIYSVGDNIPFLLFYQPRTLYTVYSRPWACLQVYVWKVSSNTNWHQSSRLCAAITSPASQTFFKEKKLKFLRGLVMNNLIEASTFLTLILSFWSGKVY